MLHIICYQGSANETNETPLLTYECPKGRTVNHELQMFKLDLEKAKEPEIKFPTCVGSWKKQESSRKTSTSALLTMPKPLTVWIKKLYKILKEMGIPDYLTCLLRNLYCRSRSNSQNWTWNNRLVPNRARSTSRLYIVTQLI